MTSPSVELGFIPADLNVNLTPRADFVDALTTFDGSDWPAGTTITLQIDADPVVNWAATVDGPLASWNVDKAAVAALGVNTPLAARVLYSNGAGADVEFYSGRVVWHA